MWTVWGGVVLVLVALPIGGAAWSADPDTPAPPPTLEERAAAIERASTEPEGDRVVVGHISRALRVPVESLRTQRGATGLGWGEILIANLLSARSGLGFDQIVAEHAAGRAWGPIAQGHGVDLVTLDRDVRETQDAVEQRSDDRAPHTSAPSPPTGHASPGARGGSGARHR